MDFFRSQCSENSGVVESLRLRFALREGGLTVGPGALCSGAVL
jgi:hypothetical protein